MFKYFFSFLMTFCLLGSYQAQAANQYRVAQGDNLYRIGLKFGIPYKEIMVANGMTKTTIYPNQVIMIPNRGGNIAKKSSPRTNPPKPPIQVAQNRPRTPAAPTSYYPPPSRPINPVESFAKARKAPNSRSINRSVEDPLGVGYNPYAPRTAPPQQPIAQARPVQSRPVQQHAPHFIPQTEKSPGTREVPAVANRSSAPSGRTYKQLDPIQIPTPSFQNPFTPSSQGSVGSSHHNHPQHNHHPQQSQNQTYIVQHNDSVWGISRKFRVSPIALRHANNIMFSRIRPGMRLVIP